MTLGLAGERFLKFNFQSGTRGDRREKVGNALFTRHPAGLPRRSFASRDKGGIDAGQRNEFSQKFFGARHAPTV